MIKSIEKLICNIEKIVLEVLFIVMTLVVLVQVFNRVLFNYPMAWADELARYLFVWVTFIASAYAVKESAHVSVTTLTEKLPPKICHIVEILVKGACLVFSLVIFVYGIKIMIVQSSMGQISPSLRIPMQYVYAGLALGALLMAFHLLVQVIELFGKPENADIAK